MTDPSFVSRLKVGETVLAARAAQLSLVAWPRKFDTFRTSRGGDIEISVIREAGPAPGELLFDSGGTWRAYGQPDGRLLLAYRVGNAIYKSVLLDPEIRTGELFFPKPARTAGPRSALQFPLDEMLFQNRWARDGLAEIHGFGVLDRGSVLLFAGHSGAGKSTLARLWHEHARDARILSDDRVLLDPRGDLGVRAFGTPWHGLGRFGSTAHGRLRALYFLEQALSTEAVPLHPAEAAARLFTRTFPPIWDARATRSVIDACASVTERVPAFLLRFRKDDSAIAVARRAASFRA